ENCPKQFHYRYVERRPVETEGIEAFVGKRVHEVLERLNQFVERGLVPSLAKVVARFRAEWEQHFDAGRIRIVRAENPVEAYRENGERCLANHYRRHYPFDRDETLGIEAHVAFPLDGQGRYRMQGFVDRISRAPDGAIEIHDYKTGRWVPSQESLDGDRQLALYQIGVQARHGGEAPVRLVWHYLLRDQVRVSTRTPEQLDALRGRTIELIERIESEQDFAPRPGSLCTWCEHNDVCPAMQARATAALAASEQAVAGPVLEAPGAIAAPAIAAPRDAANAAFAAPLEEGACEGTALASGAASPPAAERAASAASRAHQDAAEAWQVHRSDGLEGHRSDPPARHRAPIEGPANRRTPSGTSANHRSRSGASAHRRAPIVPPPPPQDRQLRLL
ncbi:MAG TPA: PD-(D/E)XK nuclease family protein, partial [Myxococcota bacterium]|nr:PD-(D/E)XK nuclease family protein [Myxococcota bacterium]